MKKVMCDHCGSEGEDVQEYTFAVYGPETVKPFPRRDLCGKCAKKVKDAFYGSVGN